MFRKVFAERFSVAELVIRVLFLIIYAVKMAVLAF